MASWCWASRCWPPSRPRPRPTSWGLEVRNYSRMNSVESKPTFPLLRFKVCWDAPTTPAGPARGTGRETSTHSTSTKWSRRTRTGRRTSRGSVSATYSTHIEVTRTFYPHPSPWASVDRIGPLPFCMGFLLSFSARGKKTNFLKGARARRESKRGIDAASLTTIPLSHFQTI